MDIDIVSCSRCIAGGRAWSIYARSGIWGILYREFTHHRGNNDEFIWIFDICEDTSTCQFVGSIICYDKYIAVCAKCSYRRYIWHSVEDFWETGWSGCIITSCASTTYRWICWTTITRTGTCLTCITDTITTCIGSVFVMCREIIREKSMVTIEDQLDKRIIKRYFFHTYTVDKCRAISTDESGADVELFHRTFIEIGMKRIEKGRIIRDPSVDREKWMVLWSKRRVTIDRNNISSWCCSMLYSQKSIENSCWWEDSETWCEIFCQNRSGASRYWNICINTEMNATTLGLIGIFIAAWGFTSVIITIIIVVISTGRIIRGAISTGSTASTSSCCWTPIHCRTGIASCRSIITRISKYVYTKK